MKQYLVFLDAECDGLYGSFLSAAMLTVDSEGKEVDRMYKGLPKEALSSVQTPWVRENVLPIMGDYDPVETEEELLEAVWDYWLKYQKNADMVVDVGYPVETRLLMRCVQKNEKQRIDKAPFPLLDLSSMLYAQSIDPLMNREVYAEGNKMHNPMTDVETAAAIWKQVIRRGEEA